MQETAEYFRLLDRIAAVVKTLPRRAAVVAVAFTKERFEMQNWVDRSRKAWPKRLPGWDKDKGKGRALLVKSARLKRSPRTVSVTDSEAIVGTDVPYARAQNFGSKGRVNQRVRNYSRKTRSGRTATVKAHNRTINQNIPQRQFIGASAVLDRRIERMMTSEILKAFK